MVILKGGGTHPHIQFYNIKKMFATKKQLGF